MKQLMRENLTGEVPDKMMDMQRSEPILKAKNNSRSAWFSEDHFRINHCFVLIFSFWPQTISSQRSKGKEIRALKSPSASWEHKNRGGHSQTSKFNLVKRNMRDCLKYFPIYCYFQTAISGLVNMSKVQTRLGALDGIGQICGELLPWMLWLSARPPRPPLDP